MSTPHIVSRVNGLKIPLLPHQGGILHRFNNPENKLVISKISTDSYVKDTDSMLTSPATPEPGTEAPSKEAVL